MSHEQGSDMGNCCSIRPYATCPSLLALQLWCCAGCIAKCKAHVRGAAHHGRLDVVSIDPALESTLTFMVLLSALTQPLRAHSPSW